MKKSLASVVVASILLLLSTIVVLPARAQGQNQRARDVEIVVGATKDEEESGTQVNLWAVIIGVSSYKYGDQKLEDNRIDNLKYAADDAQVIYEFLKTPEGGGFRDQSEGGHLILLKDEQATKTNIENELGKLKQSKPNDFFVIFFAGHGIFIPEIKSAHFLPYDADLRTSMYQDTTIRMDNFQQFILKEIPAKKGLVFTDTCHSGAGVQLAGRGAGDPTREANAAYIDALSRISTGIGFISSAGALERSFEDDKFNHGIFTYALLQGLRGWADTNFDGRVTYSELTGYLSTEVPALSDGRQHPKDSTTAVDANYLAVAHAKYIDEGARSGSEKPGLLVIRTPDIDGVEVAIDGKRFDTFSRSAQRAVLVRPGARSLSFRKGELKSDRQAKVEPGKPTLIEVNLTFSESDEDDLVEQSSQQVNAYLVEDKQPSKEAKDFFYKGVESFKKQKFEEAANHFNRALQANGGAYANALVYLGRAQQSLGRNEAAVSSFEAALKLRPTDYQTRTVLAEVKLEMGNTEEALQEIKKIVADHPNDAYARVVYADALVRGRDLTDPEKNFIKAQQQLRSATSASPKFAPAYLVLADLLTYYNSKEKQEEAKKVAEKALQLFEELSQKQVSFARGLKRLSISHVIFGGGRYMNSAVMAEAHHVLAKTLDGVVMASAADPMPNRDAYLDGARANIQKALDHARRLRDQTQLMLVYNTSAENYFLKGNFQIAIKEAEQALKTSDSVDQLRGYADPHLWLYKAYEAEQKYTKAAEHLEKFIELNKSHMNANELKEKKAELGRLKQLGDDNRQK